MSSRPDVCIVSANLGAIDEVWPKEPQDIPVDWVYFTDDPKLEVPGWEVELQKSNGHPCLAAKRFKILPPVPHRYVIWVDGNVRIRSKKFAREALTFLHDGIAVYPHPFRDCIYQEAIESYVTPKYEGCPVIDQVAEYRRGSYPDNGGLYACGVIAWDREHPDAERLSKEWMSEIEKWTFQDQLSFPVVCRRLGIEPGTFQHYQYRSPWHRIHSHLR